jgi:hypothetical protein
MPVVSAELSNPAAAPERPTLYSRVGFLLSGLLDTFSYALFHLSFSTLTHVLHAACCRFLAED